MTIKIINLPEGMPWAVGADGSLLINAKGINDLEATYAQALDDFYAGGVGNDQTVS